MTNLKETSLPKVDWEEWYRYPWHRNGTAADEKNQASFLNEKSETFAQKAHNPVHPRDVEDLLTALPGIQMSASLTFRLSENP
ncbi:MAG: hypothetical protein HQM08_09130 [Candidatus Riflebacteria bacterium]|nr:hypothetical protein [Candidatus Riflebacteria bacterium]